MFERSPSVANASFECFERRSAATATLRRRCAPDRADRRTHGGRHPASLRRRRSIRSGWRAGSRCAADRRDGFEFAFRVRSRLFETLHFDRQGARALDQGRVRRFRFGGARRLRLHRFARFEQAALRGIQQIVGGPLLGLNACDRLARLFVSRILARSSSSADRRSVAICSCFRRMRSSFSALATCSSNPTLDFSSRCSSLLQGRDGRLCSRDRPHPATRSRRAVARPTAASSRLARAVPGFHAGSSEFLAPRRGFRPR